MLLPGQTLLVVEMTPGAVRGGRRQRRRAGGAGPHARRRLDDRRRRPRLPRGHDRGYRARARRDHARARGRERDGTRMSMRRPGRRASAARRRASALAASACADAPTPLQRLREPHLPRRRPRVRRAATRCGSTGPATAPRAQIESELAVGRRAARGRRGRHLRAGARAGRRARRRGRGRRPRRAQRRAVRVAARRRARPRGRRGARRLPRCSARSPRGCTRTRARGSRPPGFDRPAWDYDAHARRRRRAGAAGRTGSAIGPEERELLGRLDATIAARLAGLRASGPSASGSSTPTSGSPTCSSTTATSRVIDFDDSGFAWFMYDFAHHGLVHGGPPARARAARRVARGLPLGARRSTPPTRPSSPPS